MSPQAEKRLIHFHTEQRETKTHTHTQNLFLGCVSCCLSCSFSCSDAHIEHLCAFVCFCICASLFSPGFINFMSAYRRCGCQPVSLPATTSAPEPAGTFALWLQFPGMSNLRQLLRTCYLRQQCASSAHRITHSFISIWPRDWVC